MTFRYVNMVEDVDFDSGRMEMDPRFVKEEYVSMRIQYCLSERFVAPCQIQVENSLLLVVCVMCEFKCLLCVLVLVLHRGGKKAGQLTTTGDAIASFIVQPDRHTEGMCAVSQDDALLGMKTDHRGSFARLAAARKWAKTSTARASQAVPRSVWLFSYALIGSSLVVGTTMLGIAIRDADLRLSSYGFGHNTNDSTVAGLKGSEAATLTLLANTPQIILSMCYMAYNGLFTRMLAEFEWASYSMAYKPLRVSEKRGLQRSSYRLQLPYRWSIPLIAVRILLHWLYSNAIYVSIYEGYKWYVPHEVTRFEALQYSTVSILVSFVVSIVVAISPGVLAWFRLPGNMVVSGGNSVVISAACHLASEKSTVDLSEAAAGRLKWGEITKDAR